MGDFEAGDHETDPGRVERDAALSHGIFPADILALSENVAAGFGSINRDNCTRFLAAEFFR